MERRYKATQFDDRDTTRRGSCSRIVRQIVRQRRKIFAVALKRVLRSAALDAHELGAARDQFKAMDLDGDGAVSRSEFFRAYGDGTQQ